MGKQFNNSRIDAYKGFIIINNSRNLIPCWLHCPFQNHLKSGYRTVPITAVEELRYSMKNSGEVYVMTTGTLTMPGLCVNIWVVELLSQPPEVLVLERDLAQSGWMVSTAQEPRMPSANAAQKHGGYMTAPIQKMLELYVQVRSTCAIKSRVKTVGEGALFLQLFK